MAANRYVNVRVARQEETRPDAIDMPGGGVIIPINTPDMEQTGTDEATSPLIGEARTYVTYPSNMEAWLLTDPSSRHPIDVGRTLSSKSASVSAPPIGNSTLDLPTDLYDLCPELRELHKQMKIVDETREQQNVHESVINKNLPPPNPSLKSSGQGVLPTGEELKLAKPPFHTNKSGHYISDLCAENKRVVRRKHRLLVQEAKVEEAKGQFVESVLKFKKALEYEMKLHGPESVNVAKSYHVLGQLHLKAKQYQNAVDELKNAIAIYAANGSIAETHGSDLWQVYDVLAQAYNGLGETKREIDHYEKAINMAKKSSTSVLERIPHMHNNVGNAYRTAGRLNEAKSHLEQSKEMMTLIHSVELVEDMAKVHMGLGSVYQDLGMFQEAINEFETWIIIRQTTRPRKEGVLLRCCTHQTLAKLYETIGNDAKAKEHEHKYKEQRSTYTSNKLIAAVKEHYSLSEESEKWLRTAGDCIKEAMSFKLQKDYKQAVSRYEKAITSLLELPDDVRNSEELLSTLALCYNNVGNAYRKTNQLKDAEKRLRDSLDLKRKLFGDEASEDMASTLFNLGRLLQEIGGRQNTQKAICIHEECLDMYKKLDGPTGKNRSVNLYRSLAIGFERIGNSRKAIKCYEDCKALLTSDEDRDELRAVCNGLGNSYGKVKDFPRAEENLMSSLNMSIERLSLKPDNVELQNHIATGHNNLGVLYQTFNQLDKAIDHLKQSLAIREKTKAHSTASTHHNIGNTLVKMEKLEEALESYRLEMTLRSDLGLNLTDVRISISNTYLKLGDLDKAEAVLAETCSFS